MSDETVIRLKPGREKSLRRRHPWVFSGAIASVAGDAMPGATAAVESHVGERLAVGAYSPRSQIRLRIWSFDADEPVDAAFIARRLSAAIAMRQSLGLDLPAGCCRLVFSESDGLPGLIVDRYGDYLVCQFLTAGIEPWRGVVVDALERLLSPRGIFERSEAGARRKEGLPSSRGLLRGEAPPAPLELVTDGLRERYDLEQGQKTGAFIDQRENRRRTAAYAKGGRVLDAYCYTGGFGLRCLLGGAESVSFLDSSKHALGLAADLANLNGLAERCSFVEDDVPRALRRLAAEGARFDLIVLDPPKFVHTAAQLQAGCRGYKDINRLALELLSPGGILATFSCSGLVDAALLQKVVAGAAVDARRDAKIIERLGQPADHPVAIHFPEAEYLKGLILRADA